MLTETRVIVCATDLEADSGSVLRQAIGLSRSAGAKLVLVHVVEGLPPSSRAMVRNILSDDELKKIHDEGMAHLRGEFLGRLRTFCARELPEGVNEDDVISEVHIAESSSAAEAIVAEAARLKADLIVMGLHSRRSGLGALLVGSVAQRVLHITKLPVLLVPTAPTS